MVFSYPHERSASPGAWPGRGELSHHVQARAARCAPPHRRQRALRSPRERLAREGAPASEL